MEILGLNEYIWEEYLYKLTDRELMDIARDNDTTIMYNKPEEIDMFFEKPSDLLNRIDDTYKSYDEFAYIDRDGYLYSGNNIFDVVDKSTFVDWLEYDNNTYDNYEEYVSDKLNEYTPQEVLNKLEYSTDDNIKEIILNKYGDTLKDELTQEEAIEIYNDTLNEDVKNFLLEWCDIEDIINNNEIEGR